VLRKGGKIVTMPLAPRTARSLDLAIGEPVAGPIFSAPTGTAWIATAPGGSCAA
jgi:integrase/recombinase XerD